MTVYLAAAVVCIALVVALVWLLRSRRVREKYASVWIVLTVAVVVLGAFPRLAFWLSHLVGVQTPVNLVFAVAIVVLLAVSMQLSTEVSSLEEEVRTLAEEVALLRLDVEQRLGGVETSEPGAGRSEAGELGGTSGRGEAGEAGELGGTSELGGAGGAGEARGAGEGEARG